MTLSFLDSQFLLFLYACISRIFVCSLHLSLKLQSYNSNCLLSLSTWIYPIDIINLTCLSRNIWLSPYQARYSHVLSLFKWKHWISNGESPLCLPISLQICQLILLILPSKYISHWPCSLCFQYGTPSFSPWLLVFTFSPLQSIRNRAARVTPWFFYTCLCSYLRYMVTSHPSWSKIQCPCNGNRVILLSPCSRSELILLFSCLLPSDPSQLVFPLLNINQTGSKLRSQLLSSVSLKLTPTR